MKTGKAWGDQEDRKGEVGKYENTQDKQYEEKKHTTKLNMRITSIL